MTPTRAHASALVILSTLAWSCGPAVVVTLPTGPGRPDARATAAFDAHGQRCRDIESWSAEVAVFGTVRGQRVRLKVLAGSTRHGDLRLEGLAPFGAPWFLLVSSAGRATVLFPRAASVLRDDATAEVLDALVGVPLNAEDLHALFTGCGAADESATNPRFVGGAWLVVDAGTNRSLFFRDFDGQVRLAGARLGALSVGYGAFEGPSPREVRLTASAAGETQPARLLMKLTQVEKNPTLSPDVFRLEIPAGARAISLEELRRRGLGPSSES